MSPSVDAIYGLLSEHNIKPSYLRMQIMKYLVTKKNHPTVDEIYSELVKEIPTLSKTTVYNTLNLFIDANIARLVTIENNETRYDADTSDHGHFKCKKCGAIHDFRISDVVPETDDLKDFIVLEKNVYCIGICPRCLINNKN
jgi:Fur family peroxide stress response transcriptional regulator